MDLTVIWSNDYFWYFMEFMAALGIVSASFFTSGKTSQMRRIGFTIVFLSGFFAIPLMIYKGIFMFVAMECWYMVIAIRGYYNNRD